MKIVITHTEASMGNYVNWLQIKMPEANVIALSHDSENHNLPEDCAGIIFSGGVDVHPQFYKSFRENYPNRPDEWNIQRDKFEINLFHEAFVRKIPILGICRGLQLINCILGGTLIQDIDEHGSLTNHKKSGGIDSRHEVFIVRSTPLFSMLDYKLIEVNSAHHQAAEHLGINLLPFAISEDGFAEGLYMPKNLYPYLFLVQWHPERLDIEAHHPASENVIQSFRKAAKAFTDLSMQ